MRPKYPSRGIVLARHATGEANVSLSMLTPEFGLVRARAQGVRKPGAKLAPALQTLTECEAVLVRGKDGWRLSGAVLADNWARKLPAAARARAGRIAALILRLVRGETSDPTIFFVFTDFLASLLVLPEDQQELAEVVAALAILNDLGLDDGEVPERALAFSPDALAALAPTRRDLILRVNRGLTASGL
jgi:recombinational DNA repair protein (RecF pathway)